MTTCSDRSALFIILFPVTTRYINKTILNVTSAIKEQANKLFQNASRDKYRDSQHRKNMGFFTEEQMVIESGK